MSNQDELIAEIKRYYEHSSADVGTLRSAYADAAHICDAIAKDFIAANRHGMREPSKAVKEIAHHITRAGNAIFALRDIVETILQESQMTASLIQTIETLRSDDTSPHTSVQRASANAALDEVLAIIRRYEADHIPDAKKMVFGEIMRALEYYADPEHYEEHARLHGMRKPGVLTDGGDLARRVLESIHQRKASVCASPPGSPANSSEGEMERVAIAICERRHPNGYWEVQMAECKKDAKAAIAAMRENNAPVFIEREQGDISGSFDLWWSKSGFTKFKETALAAWEAAIAAMRECKAIERQKEIDGLRIALADAAAQGLRAEVERRKLRKMVRVMQKDPYFDFDAALAKFSLIEGQS